LSNFLYNTKKARKKSIKEEKGDNIISVSEFDYLEDFKTYSNNEKEKKFNVYIHNNLEIVLKQNNISNTNVEFISLP